MIWLGAFAPLGLVVAGATPSSEPPAPQESLVGVVVRSSQPLEAGTVVLHRVSVSGGAEVDSVQTQDGSFDFLLPAQGGDDDVYFATVEHHGVLYHGPAFTSASIPDRYEVEVFDTLWSRGFDTLRHGSPVGDGGGRGVEYEAALELEGRTIFLEALDEGWRVTDLFSLANNTGRTVVAPSAPGTWGHPLPAGVERFEVGHGGDGPSSVMRTAEGLLLSGPVMPGGQLIIVQYILAAPWPRFPLDGSEEWVEVLVREPSPAVVVDRLPFAGRAEVTEGSTYRRYRADLPGLGSVAIESMAEEWTPRPEWAAVLVALALAVAFSLRRARLRLRPRGGTEEWGS